MRDNMPCREASAVKLAPDHTSKLDAVLVDPYFIQCLLARREEKRREKKREKKEEEENEVKKEARTEREREREPFPPLPVLMSSTPRCVVSHTHQTTHTTPTHQTQPHTNNHTHHTPQTHTRTTNTTTCTHKTHHNRP